MVIRIDHYDLYTDFLYTVDQAMSPTDAPTPVAS